MKYLLISILLFLSATALRSQDSASKDSLYTISGKVFDEDGKPVVAATVRIVGTPLGAKVKSDGTYSISRLSFSDSLFLKTSSIGFPDTTICLIINNYKCTEIYLNIELKEKPEYKKRRLELEAKYDIYDCLVPIMFSDPKKVDNYEVGTIRKLDRWDLTKTPDAKKTK